MNHTVLASEFVVREDVRLALGAAWTRLGSPGAWFAGDTRLAIAREARHARTCSLCRTRKQALSPYAASGRHDTASALPENWTDAIHRIVNDSGRLTRSWLTSVLNDEFVEDEFIELLSVTVHVTVVDAYCLGLGAPLLEWPKPVSGQPARRRDDTARPGPGWVHTIAPEDAADDFADFYANESHFYIRRSLTLLPDESRHLWDMLNTLYMPDPRVHETDGLDRAIDRAQIEYLAARTSAVLNCYY